MPDPNGTDAQQSNYQSNQNFDPHITKMYKHFVTGGHTPDDNETGLNIGIDDIRGQISISVTGQTTQNLIKSLNINTTSTVPVSTSNPSTPVLLAQESRCHALYRIIGFPVVNSDKSDFYNPGLDIIYTTGRSMDLGRKITIASNVGPMFEAISQAREAYQASTAQIFSNPISVEAGVLALTSGTSGSKGSTNIRKFAQPFIIKTDPFDFNISNQAYSQPGDITKTHSRVGNNEVLLKDYRSITGDPSRNFKPNINIGGYKIMSQHEHIIKPFMVDPRIDFSIWSLESKSAVGVSRRIAIPFVPDASYLKTGEAAKSERPLLEKIITDRVSSMKVSDAGTADTNTINYVKSIKSIQSLNIGTTTISSLFSSHVFKTSQQEAFAQYLSTIQVLMFKLTDSIRIIHKRQGEHYWLPQPSITGPEGGSTTRPVQVNTATSSLLITDRDRDIIIKQVQVILSSLNSSITQVTSVPDPGEFVFSNYKLTFDASTSDAQGDLSSQLQDTLDKTRENYLNEANDALQIVEMIMGEFSGLGLADIVAIVGSLYVMDISDLLGFLDVDAYARAQKALGTSLPAKTGSIATVMTKFASIVNDFYQIMDHIFQDYASNNAINL